MISTDILSDQVIVDKASLVARIRRALYRDTNPEIWCALGELQATVRDRKEVDIIIQITTSWHEKGRAEGNIEARREVIRKYLDRRFGKKSAGS